MAQPSKVDSPTPGPASFPITAHLPQWPDHDPTEPPALGREEVHVWAFELADPGWIRAGALTATEVERSLRFSRRRDAAAFLAGRASLRELLGGYLGIPPADVVLARRCASCGADDHGKPLLSPEAHPSAPQFSVSRSGNQGLVGLGLELALGVDIERHDTGIAVDAVLPLALNPTEVDGLEGCSGTKRASRLLTIWTLKEAYLKALGLGLARDPVELSISGETGRDWRMIDPLAEGPGSAAWRLSCAGFRGHPVAIAHHRSSRVRWLRARPPRARGHSAGRR